VCAGGKVERTCVRRSDGPEGRKGGKRAPRPPLLAGGGNPPLPLLRVSRTRCVVNGRAGELANR
jgi:hypothetical protein